jgi:hypothetical protein
MLGLKSIPLRYAPLLADDAVRQVFADAGGLLSGAPSPWELEDIPEAQGHIDVLGMPGHMRRKELSDEELREGQRRIDDAYKHINEALKALDARILQNANSGLRIGLVLTGFALIFSGVALLGMGFFQHSQLALLGKGGAATLLFTTGIPLLWTVWAKDRDMRTFTSRIRTQLAACRTHIEYVHVLECFRTKVDACEALFARIQQRVRDKPAGADKITL